MRLLAVVALLCCAPAGAQTVAITGAAVWTMTAPVPVENATIVVTDGRIASITAGGAVPAGARIIAAAGKVVTPALIDAATQIGLGEVGAIAEEQSARVGKGPLGASFDIAYAIDPDNQTLRQARADGLAWALVYPDGSSGAPFDGRGAVVRLTAVGTTVERPRAAMFATVGGATAGDVGGSRAAAWQLLRNALDEARAYRPLRHDGGPRDRLLNHLDAEALKPVLAGALPLVVQSDRLADIRQAIALARDYRLRLILFGGAEAWAAADELAAARVPVILDPLSDLPDTYDRIGGRPDNAALLAKAGVTVAFSVSAQGIYRSWNAAPAMREGAGLAVASGLPYVTALGAITSAAARVLDLGSHAGTLTAGADADLVIWDGDPLEPASAPRLVMLGGREVSPVTRQTLLRDRYAPRR